MKTRTAVSILLLLGVIAWTAWADGTSAEATVRSLANVIAPR